MVGLKADLARESKLSMEISSLALAKGISHSSDLWLVLQLPPYPGALNMVNRQSTSISDSSYVPYGIAEAEKLTPISQILCKWV